MLKIVRKSIAALLSFAICATAFTPFPASAAEPAQTPDGFVWVTRPFQITEDMFKPDVTDTALNPRLFLGGLGGKVDQTPGTMPLTMSVKEIRLEKADGTLVESFTNPWPNVGDVDGAMVEKTAEKGTTIKEGASITGGWGAYWCDGSVRLPKGNYDLVYRVLMQISDYNIREDQLKNADELFTMNVWNGNLNQEIMPAKDDPIDIEEALLGTEAAAEEYHWISRSFSVKAADFKGDVARLNPRLFFPGLGDNEGKMPLTVSVKQIVIEQADGTQMYQFTCQNGLNSGSFTEYKPLMNDRTGTILRRGESLREKPTIWSDGYVDIQKGDYDLVFKALVKISDYDPQTDTVPNAEVTCDMDVWHGQINGTYLPAKDKPVSLEELLKGTATVVETDKTALNQYIQSCETLVEADYASGWDAFQAALDEANRVSGAADAAQNTVDGALAALKAARLALTIPATGERLVVEAEKYGNAETGVVTTDATAADGVGGIEAVTGRDAAGILFNSNAASLKKGWYQIDVTLKLPSPKPTSNSTVVRVEVLDSAAEDAKVLHAQNIMSNDILVPDTYVHIPVTFYLANDTEAFRVRLQYPGAVSVKLDKVTYTRNEDGVDTDQADKTDLIAKVQAGKSLNQDAYTLETWTPFAAALEAAEIVVRDTHATQEQVDAAAAALQTAADALEGMSSNEGEYVWVSRSFQLTESNFKADESAFNPRLWFVGLGGNGQKVPVTVSVKEIVIALADGTVVESYKQPEWPNTGEVDPDMVTKSEETGVTVKKGADITGGWFSMWSNGSNPLPKGNYDMVYKVAIKISDYIPGVDTIPNPSKAMSLNLWNENLDGEIIIDTSFDELLGGTALADKTALHDAIAKADQLKEADYPAAAWKEFAAALDAAKAAADNESISQADADAVLGTLLMKMALLLPVPEKADFTALNTLIQEASQYNPADYTKETWAALVAQLDAAKAVSAKLNAAQKEIDDAAAALQSAIEALALNDWNDVDPEPTPTPDPEPIPDPDPAKNGWVLDGKIWYLYDNGRMLTGWQQDGGKNYYLGADGKMLTGWFQAGSKWYFAEKSGKVVTGWKQMGKWYYFGTDGAMKTGWYKVGNKWYFSDNTGKMVTGWKKIGKWYYFASSGAMKTGWQQVGGKWYLLGSSGAMKTGWQKTGGKWYWLNASGAMQTGWKQIAGKWYFFDGSGKMLASTTRKIGRKTYRFDGNGKCLNP